jgi:integrase/recombinase XerD
LQFSLLEQFWCDISHCVVTTIERITAGKNTLFLIGFGKRKGVFMSNYELISLVDEFCLNCRCKHYSERTVTNYRKLLSYLIRYLEDEKGVCMLPEVRPIYIKQFLLEKLEAGRKPQYVNDMLKVYKVFFRYLKEEGYTETLLTEQIKNVKQPKTIIQTFSKQELKRMLSYYSGSRFQDIRNKTVLMLFIDTGIRMNELIELNDNDINPQSILIHGKGDKYRLVPNTPTVAKQLMKYIRVRDSFFIDRRKPEGLFVSRYGKRLSKSMIEKIVKEAGAGSHINPKVRISPHTLRHTFAQQQLKNGMDVYYISRLLGHENISITEHYLQGMSNEDVLLRARESSVLMNL